MAQASTPFALANPAKTHERWAGMPTSNGRSAVVRTGAAYALALAGGDYVDLALTEWFMSIAPERTASASTPSSTRWEYPSRSDDPRYPVCVCDHTTKGLPVSLAEYVEGQTFVRKHPTNDWFDAHPDIRDEVLEGYHKGYPLQHMYNWCKELHGFPLGKSSFDKWIKERG